MRIACITSVFGGMDTQKPFVAQELPDGWTCDRIWIDENNTPVPLPNLPDRLRAKYFKLQAHRVWPGYDYYGWIDGNVEVISADFVRKIVESLEYDDIAIQAHHERLTIEEEIKFIIESYNEYLLVRYGAQPLLQEYEYYISQGMPPVAPLYSCNIFGYDAKDEDVKLFFDEWWGLVLSWSWFDQSAFSFLMWKYWTEYEIVHSLAFGQMFNNPYFTLHPHDNWNK